jgi:transcriptional regulator with XRE-family HTH domain
MKAVTTMKTNKELTIQIGERLRAERNRHNLSRSELCELAGGEVSKSRIRDFEKGIRRMGLESAVSLAQALGDVTPAYLLCLDDSGPFSEDERTLVLNYRLADDMGRSTLLKFSQAQVDASHGMETAVA